MRCWYDRNESKTNEQPWQKPFLAFQGKAWHEALELSAENPEEQEAGVQGCWRRWTNSRLSRQFDLPTVVNRSNCGCGQLALECGELC